ncbi:MarR family winged helix-turn-helix transcriptional regulator [Microbacterium sp. Leaf179]|uniref:MarR family winged helix-turn-helix transcriptional regulator n=1 Tax=Microbacterium sp. Leaf179 TaxID=1736288 RepID=UPI0006F78644|nr:MarR family winged helix-turn-helix transcriptional regulator [Microbacterium sp. Leaf179]KQR86391.1 MarR family transcriptional regulator [Microbacterium sp. Leaf179]
MTADHTFRTPQEAANDPRILIFGRLMGAANRLEYILGRELESETGLSHTLFELLLMVGRSGDGGLPVRDIAQGRVLTSGGATRLVQRGVDQGLVARTPSKTDARVQLITLTSTGRALLLRASALHARNVERHIVDVLGAEDAADFARSVRALSISAAGSLPPMP